MLKNNSDINRNVVKKNQSSNKRHFKKKRIDVGGNMTSINLIIKNSNNTN